MSKFLDKDWLIDHYKHIKQKAQARYTPELNVDLPIAQIFDFLSRSPQFYITIRTHYGNLKRLYVKITPRFYLENMGQLFQQLAERFRKLESEIVKIKHFDLEKYEWQTIYLETSRVEKLCYKIINLMRDLQGVIEKNPALISEDMRKRQSTEGKAYSTELHYLNQLLKEIGFFRDLSQSPKARLSNHPFLLINGEAGSGKTHLMCDLVKLRMEQDFPIIMYFGEEFVDRADVWYQLIKQVVSGKRDALKLLQSLNLQAKRKKIRALIIIDALNESAANFWLKNLTKLTKTLKHYPYLALVITIRNGFENETLSKTQLQSFISIEHKGFEYKEWEAVQKFFSYYRLPMPEVPLLSPEFERPLFLKLFCEGVQRREKQNKKTGKEKLSYRGHEGATYIFEQFVKNSADKIAKEFGLLPGRNAFNEYVIWDTIIDVIAGEMAISLKDRVSEEKVLQIVKLKHPSVNALYFVRSLERNLLLTKKVRYLESGQAAGYDYAFPYHRFSDHLIVRHILKKNPLNIKTAPNLFLETGVLGKLVKEVRIGLTEALSIQIPERLNGRELVEFVPWAKEFSFVKQAFLKSIVWRDVNCFAPGAKNTREILTSYFKSDAWFFESFLDAILTIAPYAQHPFNANFLHKYLASLEMPRRDSIWGTFLHENYSREGNVRRVVGWAALSEDKVYLSDESCTLYCIILIWFLSSSNRLLRDRATKALVNLLQDRVYLAQTLIKTFENTDDVYVLERLYAAMYGAVMRSTKKSDIQLLAETVYKVIFSKGKPPAHILLRDYARGIIEVALGLGIKISIRKQRISPPFGSSYPKKTASIKSLASKYDNQDYRLIWSSLMYNHGGAIADFGNYVANSSFRGWSNKRFNRGKALTIKEQYDRFLVNLSKKQKTLWDEILKTKEALRLYPIYSKYAEAKKDNEVSDKALRKYFKECLSAFKETLTHVELSVFNKYVKVYLKNEANFKSEDFDTSFAQRWMFNRIIQLGWRPELFKNFDEQFGYGMREANKAERIGKKYQWIALHECLARVSDNFEFKGDSVADLPKRYLGSWQTSRRDIDPSCLISKTQREQWKSHTNTWWFTEKYDAWNKIKDDVNWLKCSEDLPTISNLLTVHNPLDKSDWLNLEASFSWQEPVAPEEEKYEKARRDIWYNIRSYLVKRPDGPIFYEWLKKKDLNGDWMPKSEETSGIFWGEFPNSPVYDYFDRPYFSHRNWTRGYGEVTPVPVLVTTDRYFDGKGFDCSIEDTIGFFLPAKHIIRGLKLHRGKEEGSFFNASDLLAFDPSVFKSGPSALLIKKDVFLNFLMNQNYELFWTITGEKNMLGGGFTTKTWKGRLEINGVYRIKSNKVQGSVSTFFNCGKKNEVS